jgi:hypothetical protein
MKIMADLLRRGRDAVEVIQVLAGEGDALAGGATLHNVH